MNSQIVLSVILGGALVFFIWGRWRHDVVAFLALMIAAVLVISRTLQLSGALDVAARTVTGISDNPLANLVMLTLVGTVLSAFMNNVGALALMMPLAMQTARSPTQVLMPLSFATILGGMMTEIGTPPNIIIATFRRDISGEGFALFDFAPVGVLLALIGVGFLIVFGWRLIPLSRRGSKTPADLLKGASYITEARVETGSRSVGKTIRQLERLVDNEALVLGVIRHGYRQLGRVRDLTLEEDDVVILRVERSAFHKLLEVADLALVGDAEVGAETLRSEDIALVEFVVMPGARIDRRTPHDVRLTERFGTNLLAIAREGERIERPLRHTRIQAGDLLLMQGEKSSLNDTMTILGCIPLAERGLRPIRRRKRLLPLAVLAAAIAATSAGLLPIQISFSAAVVALVLFERITPREVYDSIDWSVIVLLGSLIPLGMALETTGTTGALASWVVRISAHVPVWAVLGAVMVLTMALTNLINNAATAVMMAPIAHSIALQTGASTDPFLMATAIAASSAFLTPIGHQNNVLVMGPGGIPVRRLLAGRPAAAGPHRPFRRAPGDGRLAGLAESIEQQIGHDQRRRPQPDVGEARRERALEIRDHVGDPEHHRGEADDQVGDGAQVGADPDLAGKGCDGVGDGNGADTDERNQRGLAVGMAGIQPPMGRGAMVVMARMVIEGEDHRSSLPSGRHGYLGPVVL